MTIEKKVKAYDEAVERAKKELQTCSSTDCDAARQIFRFFPELKKSEDERIRKELIEFIKSRGGFKQEYIAWLEKQGNSPIKWNKNTEGNKPQVNHSVLMKTTHGIAEGEWKGEYWEQYRWAGIVRDSDVLSWMELSDLDKQGEQNTLNYENISIQQKDFASQKNIPRYSIGDVLCDKSCTTLNKDAQSNFEITDIRNGMYICDKCSFPISQQDEYELVAKKIEQESTWNEENTSFISDLLDYFDEDKCLKHEVNDIVEWLKTIKPQQKGWSENEIKMLDNLITYLYGRKDLLEEIKRTYIDWLKSLKQKYIWKPSDEQMTALRRMKAAIAGEGEIYKPLNSLYEDLKKLKGE